MDTPGVVNHEELAPGSTSGVHPICTRASTDLREGVKLALCSSLEGDLLATAAVHELLLQAWSIKEVTLASKNIQLWNKYLSHSRVATEQGAIQPSVHSIQQHTCRCPVQSWAPHTCRCPVQSWAHGQGDVREALADQCERVLRERRGDEDKPQARRRRLPQGVDLALELGLVT